MTKPRPVLTEGQRYAHVSWDAVQPLITEVWGSTTDEAVKRVREGLLQTLADL